MTLNEDRRRASRVDTELWVAVRGVDEMAELRRANLSLTGIYLVLQRSIGEVGSLQWLQLATRDWQQSAAVMGRVSRTIDVVDLREEGTGSGVALEFIPERVETRDDLDRLVQHAVTLQLEDELEIHVDDDFELRVEHSSGEFRAAAAGAPDEPPARVGEMLQIYFRSQLSRPPVKGRVLEVARPERDGPYRLEVELVDRVAQRPTARSSLGRRTGGRSSIAEAVDLLFRDLIAEPTSASQVEHLRGALSRIQLSTLLSLFELERLSGELELSRDGEQARIFIRDGNLVDVEGGQADKAPREALAALLDWSEGLFEFRVGSVEREDRVKTPITALLLDLAREQDEAGER